ncbi:hypothetical protein [Cryptosporangium sp. NPDC051539]|uniref:hypothetical protein n=1 Tax=Cryptosporangium sp. NPDC051539 TaxID=3363962 RepID=UPI0037BE090F
MSRTPQELADSYAAVWNEPDADRRRTGVHDLWAADGLHLLQPPEHLRKAAHDLGFERSALEARGHDALEFRVRRAYEEFVAPGTFRFRSRTDAERLENVVKFHWEMVRQGDSEIAGVGLEILFLDVEERIVRDYQFVE